MSMPCACPWAPRPPPSPSPSPPPLLPHRLMEGGKKGEKKKEEEEQEEQMVVEQDKKKKRGRKSNDQEGNKSYRTLVKEKNAEYGFPENKRELSILIFGIIQSKGGRFLIETKTGVEPRWRVMTLEKALQKIEQSLRDDNKMK